MCDREIGEYFFKTFYSCKTIVRDSPIWFWQITGKRICSCISIAVFHKCHTIRILIRVCSDERRNQYVLRISSITFIIAILLLNVGGIRICIRQTFRKNQPVCLEFLKSGGYFIRVEGNEQRVESNVTDTKATTRIWIQSHEASMTGGVLI